MWLPRYPDSRGERGRHLLEVLIEMTEGELAAYASEVAADEARDDEVGDFAEEEDEAQIERFTGTRSLPRSSIPA